MDSMTALNNAVNTNDYHALKVGTSKRRNFHIITVNKNQENGLNLLMDLTVSGNILIISRNTLSEAFKITPQNLSNKLNQFTPYIRFTSNGIQKGQIKVEIHPQLFMATAKKSIVKNVNYQLEHGQWEELVQPQLDIPAGIFYLYTVYVNDVIRYVGKGSNDRYLHATSGTSHVYELNKAHFNKDTIKVKNLQEDVQR